MLILQQQSLSVTSLLVSIKIFHKSKSCYIHINYTTSIERAYTIKEDSRGTAL